MTSPRWTLLDHVPAVTPPQRAGVTTGRFVSADPVTGRGVVSVYDVDAPVRLTPGVYSPGAVVRVTVDATGRPVWADPPAVVTSPTVIVGPVATVELMAASEPIVDPAVDDAFGTMSGPEPEPESDPDLAEPTTGEP